MAHFPVYRMKIITVSTPHPQHSGKDQQSKAGESLFVNAVMLTNVTLVIVIDHFLHAIRNDLIMLPVYSQ